MWVRFFDPTLGDMHRYNGELIGNLMGETLDVDVGPGEMAIGKFMRFKMSVAGTRRWGKGGIDMGQV